MTLGEGRHPPPNPVFLAEEAGEEKFRGKISRKIVRVTAEALRASQAYIGFRVDLPRRFGITRRIVRVIIPGS